MLVNQAGTTVWEGQYSAFGIQLDQTNQNGSSDSAQALRFPGQYADSETQLYYNWNRYYDPEIGRYTTSDPIGLADGFNTHTYAYLGPIAFLDHLGLYGGTTTVDTYCIQNPGACGLIGAGGATVLTDVDIPDPNEPDCDDDDDEECKKLAGETKKACAGS